MCCKFHHWVWPPSAWSTGWMRSCIDSTSELRMTSPIFSHSCCKAIRIPAADLMLRLFKIDSFMRHQILSIRFISGQFAGHLIFEMPWFSHHSFANLRPWTGATSSINVMSSELILEVRKHWRLPSETCATKSGPVCLPDSIKTRLSLVVFKKSRPDHNRGMTTLESWNWAFIVIFFCGLVPDSNFLGEFSNFIQRLIRPDEILPICHSPILMEVCKFKPFLNVVLFEVRFMSWDPRMVAEFVEYCADETWTSIEIQLRGYMRSRCTLMTFDFFLHMLNILNWKLWWPSWRFEWYEIVSPLIPLENRIYCKLWMLQKVIYLVSTQPPPPSGDQLYGQAHQVWDHKSLCVKWNKLDIQSWCWSGFWGFLT